MNNMKVNFFLTEPTCKIVGGYKMVYIYSNYIAEQGDNVTIYYFCSLKKFMDIIKLPLRYLLTKLPIQWFDLNNKVKRKLIISYKKIQNSDINIITASPLATSIFEKCKNTNIHFHLIQDYEKWCLNDEELYNVFKLPTKKVVVSKWLYDIVSIYDTTVETVSNGINFDDFYITTPIEDRKMVISMLYHTDKRKGVDRGIEIIKRLKEELPELKCIMFGSPKRGENIPQWVEYHRNVNADELRNIYNQSSVFLSTSYYEGFGLTGLESLACGCALASTDTAGVNEYAIRDFNSLISHPEDSEKLYKNAKILLSDKQLRLKFEKNFATIRCNYNQDSKNKEFYNILKQSIEKN